ncbi:MAG: methyl-accepting chemotaxis protein, partial [Planctomycetes bacterium]|nr:methyl-accepting chemotaxis protein [Planctomycetota bacterium]
RIERIQTTTTESVAAINEIDDVITKVNHGSRSIAASVAEQRSATQEIAANLAQATRTVDTLSSNVTEGATACREISRAISTVDAEAIATSAGAEQTAASGSAMKAMATQLMTAVRQFRT